MSQFSPSMLNALEGLLSNTGLDVSAEMVETITEYRLTPIVASIRRANPERDKLSGTALSQWDAFIDAVPAAITDSIPLPPPFYNWFASGQTTFDAGRNIPSFTQLPLLSETTTELIEEWANVMIFNGSISKFVQLFSALRSQKDQANAILGPVANALSPTSTLTFRDTDAQTSGGISELTKSLAAFAEDLFNTGYTINFEHIARHGDPVVLLGTLANVVGGLPAGVVAALQAEAVDASTIAALGNFSAIVSDRETAKVFRALLRVTGEDLRQVLAMMKVKTTGLETLQDLLNPLKIFPNSYQSLTLRTKTGLVLLYTGTEVSSAVQDVIRPRRLGIVTEENLARANIVLSIGFRQVTGIEQTDPMTFANALGEFELNTGLVLVEGLTSPVPETETIYTVFGEGTGEKNLYTTADVVGTPAGIPHTAKLREEIDIMVALSADNAFDDLQWQFQRIQDVMTGEQYVETLEAPPPPEPGDPGYDPGDAPYPVKPDIVRIVIPGFGSWGEPIPLDPLDYFTWPETVSDPHNDAIVALLNAIQPALDAFLDDYAEEASQLEELHRDILRHIDQEIIFRTDFEDEIGFYLAQVPVQRGPIVAFVRSLHEIGTDTISGGAAEVIENMADRSILAGESIIAAMREGRNLKAMSDAGLTLNPYLPAS